MISRQELYKINPEASGFTWHLTFEWVLKCYVALLARGPSCGYFVCSDFFVTHTHTLPFVERSIAWDTLHTIRVFSCAINAHLFLDCWLRHLWSTRPNAAHQARVLACRLHPPLFCMPRFGPNLAVPRAFRVGPCVNGWVRLGGWTQQSPTQLFLPFVKLLLLQLVILTILLAVHF